MVLVLIHECGHFFTAKKSGVKVLEFGIGIPPKVCNFGKDKKGTRYSLNWIPLGGFVRLKWEDPKHDEDFHAKDSFMQAKLWKKVVILLAWVSMNVLLAYVLFVLVFVSGVKPISIIPDNALSVQSESYLMPTVSFLDEQWLFSGDVAQRPALIEQVAADMLWSKLWLKSWDIITDIAGQKITTWNIWRTLRDQIGHDFYITYIRNWQTITSQWSCSSDECMLGVLLSSSDTVDIKELKFPFGQALIIAAKEIKAEIRLTFTILWNFGKTLLSLDSNKIKWVINKFTWPAGAIKFGEVLREQRWWIAYLGFAGMISLALAIFNVLPIPALDGGRLLGMLIQAWARLKPQKYFIIEWYINLFFFLLLMWFGIYILIKDLVVFWGFKIPFIG